MKVYIPWWDSCVPAQNVFWYPGCILINFDTPTNEWKIHFIFFTDLVTFCAYALIIFVLEKCCVKWRNCVRFYVCAYRMCFLVYYVIDIEGRLQLWPLLSSNARPSGQVLGWGAPFKGIPPPWTHRVSWGRYLSSTIDKVSIYNTIR